MPKYTFSEESDGNESGYESDDGTEYKYKQRLKNGSYAHARLFKSTNGQKAKVVLNPRCCLDHLEEAETIR
ncbi:MAG TPA: hypothetical protein VHZ76_00650 [Gammaproteobacteria bacterium]|jgi:hypothetical protein|nr:hypothetical protein [Gammaproteobacteria bacterium]